MSITLQVLSDGEMIFQESLAELAGRIVAPAHVDFQFFDTTTGKVLALDSAKQVDNDVVVSIAGEELLIEDYFADFNNKLIGGEIELINAPVDASFEQEVVIAAKTVEVPEDTPLLAGEMKLPEAEASPQLNEEGSTKGESAFPWIPTFWGAGLVGAFGFLISNNNKNSTHTETNAETAEESSETIVALRSTSPTASRLVDEDVAHPASGVIDLVSNTQAQNITLTTSDVLSMADANNLLRIEGAANDSVTLQGFSESHTQAVEGYHQYTNNQFTVMLDSDIMTIIM